MKTEVVFIVFFCVGLTAFAQQPEGKPPSAEKPAAIPMQEAMRRSIEIQKASVRRQVQGAVPQGEAPAASSSWFSHPWPSEPVDPPSPPSNSIARADCDPMPVEQIDSLIKDAATKQNLREDLVRTVIQRESAFRPCAVSTAGAQGLMQLMPATAADLGVRDVFDPKENIDAGTRYLKQLLDKYQGNMELALAAYNAGPARVDRAGGVPPIAETRQYILNILSKIAF